MSLSVVTSDRAAFNQYTTAISGEPTTARRNSQVVNGVGTRHIKLKSHGTNLRSGSENSSLANITNKENNVTPEPVTITNSQSDTSLVNSKTLHARTVSDASVLKQLPSSRATSTVSAIHIESRNSPIPSTEFANSKIGDLDVKSSTPKNSEGVTPLDQFADALAQKLAANPDFIAAVSERVVGAVLPIFCKSPSPIRNHYPISPALPLPRSSISPSTIREELENKYPSLDSFGLSTGENLDTEEPLLPVLSHLPEDEAEMIRTDTIRLWAVNHGFELNHPLKA